MTQYLIETYNFSKEVAEKIKKEYDLFVLRTNSNLSIDDFVKVILNAPTTCCA